MKHFPLKTSQLALTTFLLVVALAVGTFAYNEPFAAYPANTQEPIDTSTSDQAKVGSLSVFTFYARGNADFKQDLAIYGVAHGGNPGDLRTNVAVASNVLTTGDLKANLSLSAASLVHNESNPKPVCADDHGIVVFCPGTIVSPPADLCDNIPGIQATLNSDLTIEDSSKPKFCTQTIRATVWAGPSGNYARNMAGNAELMDVGMRNITINSIGGIATTVWPSAIPLKFNWAFCSGWNTTNYSGPSNASGETILTPTIGGSVNNGYCENLPPNWAHPTPYGYQNNPGVSQYFYTAWDGITWAYNVGYPSSYFGKGFFDGGAYDLSGAHNPVRNYTTNLWYQKNHGGDPTYANIMLPIERLIMYDIDVPSGYKIKLTSAKPQTTLEQYFK